VSFTGEVGLVKILESSHRKNGVRLRMLAGKAAFDDYKQKSESTAKISALLSAKQDAVADAVERILSEKEQLTFQLGGLARRVISSIAESVQETDGNLIFFESGFSVDDLRLLCNAVLPKCGGICAAFSGSDDEGYKYVMASNNVDLRSKSKEINTFLTGRGGGTPQMIQGSAASSKETIENYFNQNT
jgi:alanyl-tRNA synthetase